MKKKYVALFAVCAALWTVVGWFWGYGAAEDKCMELYSWAMSPGQITETATSTNH